MVDAPKKYFRLKPDGEVRLKGAYIIKCERYDLNDDGSVACVYCTIDPDSKSGMPGADRKVKGTIHWVSATENIPLEARLYDVLILDDKTGDKAEEAPADAAEDEESEEAAAGDDFLRQVNPDSLTVVRGYGEPWLASAKVGDSFQFLRNAYFCKDKDSADELAVFNRVVILKDSFKVE